MQLIARSVAAALAALFLLGPTTSVSAQSFNLSNPDSVGIQVSPVVDDFDINPGETVARTMTVTGLTQQSVTYFPVVVNFEADKTTGKPVFFNDDERFSKYALSQWVSFTEKSFTIEPGAKEVIRYTVTAPANASPGGHYGAVLLSTEAPEFDDEGILVGVVGLIGTLVLTTVPGDITEQLAISDFQAPTFLVKPPADFSVTIGNLGNVHLRPEGGITIRNWFGKQVVYLPINDGKAAVLPESQRLFENSWGFSWSAFGRYSANLSLSYGDGKSVAELRTFYVIPIWFIVALGAAIIWFIIRKLWRKRPAKPLPQPKRRIVMG